MAVVVAAGVAMCWSCEAMIEFLGERIYCEGEELPVRVTAVRSGRPFFVVSAEMFQVLSELLKLGVAHG